MWLWDVCDVSGRVHGVLCVCGVYVQRVCRATLRVMCGCVVVPAATCVCVWLGVCGVLVCVCVAVVS